MFSLLFFIILCGGLILVSREIKLSKLSPFDKKLAIGFFMCFLI